MQVMLRKQARALPLVVGLFILVGLCPEVGAAERVPADRPGVRVQPVRRGPALQPGGQPGGRLQPGVRPPARRRAVARPRGPGRPRAIGPTRPGAPSPGGLRREAPEKAQPEAPAKVTKKKTRRAEHGVAGAVVKRAKPVKKAKRHWLNLIVFLGLAVGCVFFALVMITRKSPMMSALSLLVVFLCLAGLYVFLKAPFMAAIQLIVYAGAVIVLFIFVIMSIGMKEDQASVTTASELSTFLMGFVATGAGAAAVLFETGIPRWLAYTVFIVLEIGALVLFVMYLRYPVTRFLGMIAASLATVQIIKIATLNRVLVGPSSALQPAETKVIVASPLADDFGGAASVGRSIFGDNVFAFEALSLLLLAAIVAAVVIVRSRKEQS